MSIQFLFDRYSEQICARLLNIAASSEGTNAGTLLRAVDANGTPLLDTLISCEQKHVVKQPLVQEHLTDVWKGGVQWSGGWKITLFFLLVLLCPPLWVALCLPYTNRLIEAPVVKFICYMVSHAYLLLLLVLVAVLPLHPVFTYEATPLAVRDHFSLLTSDFCTVCFVRVQLVPRWNEALLLVWIAGQLVAQLANPSDSSPFGVARVAILAASAAAILLHLVALVCILIDVDDTVLFVDFFQLVRQPLLYCAHALLTRHSALFSSTCATCSWRSRCSSASCSSSTFSRSITSSACSYSLIDRYGSRTGAL